MPLVKETLKAAIIAACQHKDKDYSVEQFASDLTDAIHTYVSAATIVVPTLPVQTIPATGTGATVAPVTLSVV